MLILTSNLHAATPPERISISGTEFRACNGASRIWMAGCNTPWDNWNDFGGTYDNAFWSSHYQTLGTNKINSSRVWISCSGEVGINISNAGLVSGATAAHWAALDQFFAVASARKIYVMATLISFDHFKDSYTAIPPGGASQASYLCWRNWVNSDAGIDSYINNYLNEFMNRYGQNPWLWSIDLTNEPEWAMSGEGGTLAWNRMQRFWGLASKAIHEHPNNGGVLVTVGMGTIKHSTDTRPLGGSNKVSDAALRAASVNDPDVRLDFWSPHHYLWMITSGWGNPFTMTPAAYGLTPDRPAMLGETPNDGGSDADKPTAVDGPRTLAEDFSDAFNNGWQGALPWTSNNAGSGNFGDWDNDINDATIPFDAAHPGLVFPVCAVNTATRTPTRTATRTATRTPTPAAGPYLKTYADPCNINVGTAVVWSAFNAGPGPYRTTLEQNFNLVEPENEMKWGEIRPNQATFNYTKSDTLITWAQARNMKIRGHVLAWHQDNPAWLTGGGFNAAQLNTILRTHIQTVMPHYAGKVYAWDVVNEAFNEDGTIRSSIWSNSPGIGLPGTQWIEQAFVWARAADPGALLFYNDYNNEPMGYAKADAVYNMAVDFVNRGVPLDGIGMQIHVVAGAGFPNPTAVRNQINRITALGLQVEITELDVRIQLPTDAAKLAQQAATAQAIIDACLDNPNCRTVQWWGHTDNYSWVPATFPGYGDALLLDTAYNPKPVYNTFLNELNRPCLSTPTRTRTPASGTATVSPTLTPTPFSQLFDDFEDLNLNNNWGGAWSSYQGAASSVTLTVAGPGAPGSALGRAQVSANIADYGGMTATFSGSPRDLSGYVGIQFRVRGSGTHWFQSTQTSIADGDHFGATFTATGAWSTVTLLFSAFAQRGFGAATGFNLAQIASFQWASNANGAMNFELDDVQLLSYVPAFTATASRTSSPAQSRTASPSATLTATPSATPTGTPSRTATFSQTPSPTPSRTPSGSHSATPSRSPSPSSTATPSGSATASASFTPASSGTLTSSPTRTPSASPSATPSLSRTVSGSPSPTPASTATPSPSQTLSDTFTASSTLSRTATRSGTPSATATRSATAAASMTATLTLSGSFTASASPTPTPTPSASWTLTLSPTRTSLDTPTLSQTASPSPSGSGTASPSATLTPSRTALVLSATVTHTATPSPSPSAFASPAFTAVPEPGDGPLKIESSFPIPNPNPELIRFKLGGPAVRIRLTIWSKGMTLIAQAESGPFPKGWASLALPADFVIQAANGAYYYRLVAERGGERSKAQAGKLLVLR